MRRVHPAALPHRLGYLSRSHPPRELGNREAPTSIADRHAAHAVHYLPLDRHRKRFYPTGTVPLQSESTPILVVSVRLRVVAVLVIDAHVVLGIVQEADQAVDLISGLFAEPAIARKISAGLASAAMSSQSRPAVGVIADVFRGGVKTLSARVIGCTLGSG